MTTISLYTDRRDAEQAVRSRRPALRAAYQRGDRELLREIIAANCRTLGVARPGPREPAVRWVTARGE